MNKISRLVVIVLVIIMSSGVIAQAQISPTESPLCFGLTGQEKGLCVAAVAIGCDNLQEPTVMQCEMLSENFEQVSGQLPPWEVICPCYNIEMINYIYDQNPNTCMPTECNDDLDPNANDYTRTEWLNESYLCGITQVAVWTWESFPTECWIGGTAIPDYGIESEVTKEEALACSHAIKNSKIWELCP